MKRFLGWGTLVVALAIVTVSYWKTEKNPRKDYEKFLVEEYGKIPFVKKEVDGKKMFDTPHLSGWRDYFMMLDPEKKRVPMERLKSSRIELRNLQAQKNANFDLLNWNRIESNMGGRTRTLMWDPTDPETKKAWAGSVTGGLWYNDNVLDPNSSWHPASDLWSNLTIGCMTYDPNNPSTFYVGTGEAPTAIITYRESSGVGVGIWKTEDAGQTWELLPSTEDFKYITDIEVKNEYGQSVIYAGVVSGTYKGVDHQSGPTDGLYRSTDGGESWTQVLPNIEGEDVPYAPSDVEINGNGRIFVGTGRNLEGKGASRILYSDTGLEGSWNVFDQYVDIIENDPQYYLTGRVMIASSPSDPDNIYAMIAAGYMDGFPYYHGKYILKSTNNGETWNSMQKPDAGEWATLAWHAFTIAVHPDNPDGLFVGGLDLYHTLNSGSYWSHVSDWAMMYYGGGDEYVHADNHVIKFRPGHPNDVIFGTDGGIFYTNNASESYPVFQERNHHYSSLMFYSCAIHPDPITNHFAGGLQDNGSLVYLGNDLEISNMTSGGDGAFTYWDKVDPQYHITSVYYNSYYTWAGPDYDNFVNYAGTNSGTFVCPGDYNSHTKTLFANAHGFFGENQGKILRMKGMIDYAYEDFVSLNVDTDVPFSAVSLSPYSPTGESNLFIGTQAGKLFRADGMEGDNPSVQEIGSPEFPNANISCIAVGGSDDTLAVTFSNFGVSSIWMTTDGGNSWKEKESNLPDMPIRWILLHPESSNYALIATEMGVWVCNNLLDDEPVWEANNNGLSNVRVDMLKLREADMTVLAASHGRGLHTAVWDINNIGTNELEAKSIKVWPNPASTTLNVHFDGHNAQSGIFDMNGKQVMQTNLHNGLNVINVSALSSGTYILKSNEGSDRFSQKIIIK